MRRRLFLKCALGAGAAVILPGIQEWVWAAAARTADSGGFFLKKPRWSTCAALCARIVPAGPDPRSAPGAAGARAVVFIDRFLAAFELPPGVADHPAVWLRGRFSGRDPYPDPKTGRPAGIRPADDMLGPDGQARFLPLTARQELSWRAQLYGPEVLVEAAKREPRLARWAAQVADGTVPGPPPGGLRGQYAAGLDAFDAWSRQVGGKPFFRLAAALQDRMLDTTAARILASRHPGPAARARPSGLPPPPPAALHLFPTLVHHTFQGCYGLPEYRWVRRNPLWAAAGFEGDTQPLGSSIYDERLTAPGAGENAGFGEEGVYLPRGGYREYRPVSGMDPHAAPLSASQARTLGKLLQHTMSAGGR